MEDFRGKYVHRSIFHFRRVPVALDCFRSWRLEDLYFDNQCAFGVVCVYTVFGAWKC